jgi:hypothetical protein
MTLQVLYQRGQELWASLRFMLIASFSAARGISLFLSGRPRTPLRVLCVMAFDTLHMLRHRAPLPIIRLNTLAVLLDCGACANAAFDNKDWRRREFRRALGFLERAGIRPSVAEYLQRLKDLESNRPAVGRDARQFQDMVRYRESVVRLSLAILATTADSDQTLDEAIRTTQSDADLSLLFRIVMQCQIIDDVLDYRADVAARLPSFLTGATPLRLAFEQTQLAVSDYANGRDLPRKSHYVLLRWALVLVSICAKLTIVFGRFQYRREGDSQHSPTATVRGLTARYAVTRTYPSAK